MQICNKLILTLLLFTMALVSTIAAQDVMNVTMVGNYGKGEGSTKAVFAAGSIAYFGVGNKIKIMSFSDPANPQIIGAIEVSDLVEDLVRTSINSTNYLVAVGGEKLWLINVQNPTLPSLASSTSLEGGFGEGVGTSGYYAYVAAGGKGLQVYDISAPATPSKISEIDSLEWSEGLSVVSPYVYVASGGRTHIIDINNPAALVYKGQIQATGWHQNVGVRSGYAYVCDWDNSLQVFNVTDPANPSFVTSLDVGRGSNKIIFDGNYGYLSVADTGLAIINVTNLSSPTLEYILNTPGTPRSVSFGAITIGGQPKGHIYVADHDGGLRVVNVSTPSAPVESGAVEIQSAASGDAYACFVESGRLYVAYGSAGVRVLDLSSLSAPALIGEFDTDGDARGIVVINGIAYVADRDNGVVVIDFTNPASPNLIRTFKTARARYISLSGNHVYVAADVAMVVIDATNPADPDSVMSENSIGGESVGSGSGIVAVSNWSQVGLYDASNPAGPVLTSNLNDFINTNDWHGVGAGAIAIEANHAFIVNADTLRIFDLSNLGVPVAKGKIGISEEWDGAVSVSDNFAYVADGSGGLRIMDVEDIMTPQEVGYYDGPSTARGVYSAEGYAYVAEMDGGVTIYRNELYTDITPAEEGIPGEFRLGQNYPNPFNPGTKISFSLPVSGQASLKVFNILGQEIQTLINERMNAGKHDIQFDASHLANGLYFYKLEMDGYSAVRKMILIK